REIADALNRLDEAEQLISEFEERARTIGERLGAPESPPQVAVLRAFPDALRYELPGIFSGSIVYGDVGLAPPSGFESEAAAGEFGVIISAEKLLLGDAPNLIMYSFTTDVAADFATVRDQPLFPNLQAAQEGNVFEVGSHWFDGSLIAANLILDDLERIFL
ncbi:MAG: hypothetical protein AAGG08_14960, partial [Actinomycetota bacterium]